VTVNNGGSRAKSAGNLLGQNKEAHKLKRSGVFVYDLVVLGILVLLGALYIKFPLSISLGDDPYKLAIESMWFGSLGGVIISLKGIYDHSIGSDPWDPSYNLWHLGCPISVRSRDL